MYKYRLLQTIKLALALLVAYMLVDMVFVNHTPRVGNAAMVSASDNNTDINKMNKGQSIKTAQGKVPDNSIIEHNLFAGKLGTRPTIKTTSPVPVDVKNIPELDLELCGTIAGEPDFARAIIKNNDTKTTDSYKTGSVISGARLMSITESSVILNYKGKIVELKLSSTTNQSTDDSIITPVKTKLPPTISTNHPHRHIVHSSSSLDDIISNGQIEPYIFNHKIEGLRIVSLKNINLPDNLDLEKDDILQYVNGQKLTSMQKAYQVFKKARTRDKMEIVLARKGKKKKLVISLKNTQKQAEQANND